MNKRTITFLGIGIGIAAIAAGALLIRRRLMTASEETDESNAVDVASEESFPASDPPSWTPVQSVGLSEEAS